MRIISGSVRGKRLSTFSGGDIRPTPDRVREAVFSILASRLGSLSGMTVLDLFAGTGAMALEALSRGASRAVLVDRGPQSAAIIPANIAACGMANRAVFHKAEVMEALSRLDREKPFDLIFLDPPYGRDLVPAVLTALDTGAFLAPGGIVCAEAAREDEIPDRFGGLVRSDWRPYGSTAIHLFMCPDLETEGS